MSKQAAGALAKGREQYQAARREAARGRALVGLEWLRSQAVDGEARVTTQGFADACGLKSRTWAWYVLRGLLGSGDVSDIRAAGQLGLRVTLKAGD